MQGLGTKLEKIELLQLADFATIMNDQIIVTPNSQVTASSYPFILRVIDAQNKQQLK